VWLSHPSRMLRAESWSVLVSDEQAAEISTKGLGIRLDKRNENGLAEKYTDLDS